MYNTLNGAFTLSEFALGIALTVFVGTTVLLTILIISLATSKSFRAVFFREHREKKNKPKKSKSKSSDPLDGLEEIPVPVPQPPTINDNDAADRQAQEEREFLERVETIPLQAMSLPTDQRRAHRIPIRKSSGSTETEGGTYSPRMITITRARNNQQNQTKPHDEQIPDKPITTARRGVKRD